MREDINSVLVCVEKGVRTLEAGAKTMEKVASVISRLKKMSIFQIAEGLKEIDIKKISVTSCDLQVLRVRLFVSLVVIRSQDPPSDILSRTEALKNEITILGDRITVAVEARDKDLKEIVSGCKKILRP